MGIAPPPSVNYSSPIVAVPALWNRTPPEGARTISCEIDWGTMGGANNSVYVNAAGGGSMPNISQIAALTVDNTASGAPVQFVFTDNLQTLTVEAGALLTAPVFTGATQFYVVGGANIKSGDVTRFVIHNAMPPPVALPPADEISYGGGGGVAFADGNTQIISTTVSGTLREFELGVAVAAAAAWGSDILVEDGTGKIIVAANVFGLAGTTVNAVLSRTASPIRFSSGLILIQSNVTAPSSGNLYSNSYYTVP